jgi:hypothetical protein
MESVDMIVEDTWREKLDPTGPLEATLKAQSARKEQLQRIGFMTRMYLVRHKCKKSILLPAQLTS